jgi:hypothetical protein
MCQSGVFLRWTQDNCRIYTSIRGITHGILLVAIHCAEYWVLAIQLPLWSTFTFTYWRPQFLIIRSRLVAPQWRRWINRIFTCSTTWKIVNDSVFHIPLCISYCRWSCVSCRVHQVWFWKLGWNTIPLQWLRVLWIGADEAVLCTIATDSFAHSWTLTRDTNLERRGNVSSWNRMQGHIVPIILDSSIKLRQRQ